MSILYVNTANSASGDGTTNQTDGSADSAYKTLYECVDALSLVTLTEPLTIYCEGSTADTTSVGEIDAITSAANYILITTTTANRHDGKWNTGKYRLEITNNFGFRNNTSNHVRVDGLQIKVTITDASSTYYGIKMVGANNTTVDVRLSNTIVQIVPTDGTAQGIVTEVPSTGGTAKIWNCIAYGSTNSYGIYSNWNGTSWYNCTSYGNQYNFGNDAPSTYTLAINCCAAAPTPAVGIDWVGDFHASSDCNSSSDGTHPGSNGRTGTPSFVDAANKNFHLQSGDTVAKDYGNGANVKATFTTDIDGDTRPATDGDWDIGADEYVVPAVIGGVLNVHVRKAL